MAVATPKVDPRTGMPLNVAMPGMPTTPTQAGYSAPPTKPTPAPYTANGINYSADGRPYGGNTPIPTGPVVQGHNTGVGTYGNNSSAPGQAYGGTATPWSIKTAAPPPKTTDTGKVVGDTGGGSGFGAGTGTGTPIPDSGLYKDPYARTPESIAALAKNRIDAILQAGRTSAAGARTGAKNVYDYENQITGDNRTLRNATFKEENNPFSGQTGYLASNMLRNDNIQDTAHDKDYQANVGLINQKLADLEAAAPGQEQQIIDDLQQIERQTGISVAQLQLQQQNQQFNQFDQNRNYDRNIANDKYDQSPTNPINVGRNINNQIDQLKLDDYPEASKAAAQLTQQELATGKITQETAQLKLTELKDPNSFTNRTAKLEMDMKELEAKNAPETERIKLQKLKKELADVGVAHYKPQTQAEKEYDEQQVIKIKQEIENLKTPKAGEAPLTAEGYQKNLKPRYEDGVLVNAQQIEDQIILSGMSDYEQYRAYIANGLPWTDPIPKK